MVDVVFADVAQPDQARIVAMNATNFLKNGGHYVISIKVSTVLRRVYVCPGHSLLRGYAVHHNTKVSWRTGETLSSIPALKPEQCESNGIYLHL